MDCPFCHKPDTRVMDTRHVLEGNHVRRRRECDICQKRFTTHEKAELNMPMVIKNDGRRIKFEEEKLRKGIFRALEKRPIPLERIENMIDEIKNKLLEFSHREIDSRVIGEWVMEALSQLDAVAYVRFASVYQNFENLDAFKEAIKQLKKIKNPSLKII